jgi:hypothetical protein
MSPDLARRVYEVLVEVCGASADDPLGFVYHYSERKRRPSNEFRFCGALGFGGKFRYPAFSVDCYPEDETPDRRELIVEANKRLALLRREFEAESST